MIRSTITITSTKGLHPHFHAVELKPESKPDYVLPMSDDLFQDEPAHRRERLIYVPVDQLTEGPHAPAQVAVPEELVSSLTTYGILHPLLVRPSEGGYEVIAGFRRLRAAKQADLSEVPVRVYRAEDASLKAMYEASNTGNPSKPRQRVTVPPTSAPDGITGGGTLGGFLEEELGRTSHSVPYGKIIGITATLLLLGWGGLVLSRNWRDRTPTPSAPSRLSSQQNQTQTRVDPTPEPRRQTPSSSAARTVGDWRTDLAAIPGIQVRDVSGIPRIVFGAPVFSRLTTIDTAQKDLLKDLVGRILEMEPRAMIMVIGHTDNDPIRPSSQYRSNEYLSELRANAVIDYLKDANIAPGTQLRPVSSIPADAPFTNDTAENKARNRTVTLEIMVPTS